MSVHQPNILPKSASAPDASSIEIVPADALDSGPVSEGVRYWNALKGDRALPSRNELVPARMAKFLRNIVLARVIDNGVDYEYRVVGDAHVQAQGYNFRHMRLKEIESKRLDFTTRPTYEHVRVTGVPFAVRGWIGRHVPHSRFSYHETAFLPLGENGVVDHLLIISTYVPRGG